MTAYYIDSNASGANDGTSWTDAYSDIATALSGKAAGDVFYCASNHSHSQASTITYALPASTLLNPVVFISCSTAASPPTTYTRGAKEATTNPSGNINLASTGGRSAVFIGFDFSSDNDLFVGDSNSDLYLYDCLLEIAGGNAADRLYYAGDDDASVYYENCEFKLSHTSQQLRSTTGTIASTVRMVDCGFASGTTGPSFSIGSPNNGRLDVRGWDLTNCASTIDVVYPTSTSEMAASVRMSGVKLPTSWSGTVMGAASVKAGDRYEFYSLDDGDTINQIYIDAGGGTVRTETTTVHTGTYDGTNKYSMQVINDAAAEEAAQPMWVKVAEFWADANPTLKVNITSDSTLDDQECWIEVESPDATTGALHNFQRSRNSNYFLGTGTTLTSGSGWTSAKTNSYEISETVSGGQAGVHSVYLYLASDSAKTIYVDPHVVIT